MNDNIQKIKELTKYLNKCRDAYYNTPYPIITDEEYDELYDQLQHMENEYGYYENVSPTVQVGYEVRDG